jgi:hypothetical protein
MWPLGGYIRGTYRPRHGRRRRLHGLAVIRMTLPASFFSGYSGDNAQPVLSALKEKAHEL